MPPSLTQFCDLDDAKGAVHAVLLESLEALLPDLADAPWLLREREVINLLVFRHLVPRFQSAGIDIAQIGIEVPTLKSKSTGKDRLTSGGDLVIWPHAKASVWRRCKPLTRVEWKNISCRERRRGNIRRDNRTDLVFLQESPISRH